MLYHIRSSLDQVQKTLPPKLVTVTATELVAKSLPPREAILSPWLLTQGLAMVHAPRGIGKTFLSLSIAYSVATGTDLLNWTVPKPRGVLFIDGEMPASALQERLKAIMGPTPKDPGPLLQIITPDLQEAGLPDLARCEGQEIAMRSLRPDTELIVLDNLSSLLHSGVENDAESWEDIQTWLLGLRRLGRSVLFIHHSSKSGMQRGTSRREDVLDTVIKLERPSGYTASQGARFKLTFEKTRHFHGDAAAEFVAQFSSEAPGQPWTVLEGDEAITAKVIQLFQEGVSQKDIAKEVGRSEPTISRMLKQARESGRLESRASE